MLFIECLDRPEDQRDRNHPERHWEADSHSDVSVCLSCGRCDAFHRHYGPTCQWRRGSANFVHISPTYRPAIARSPVATVLWIIDFLISQHPIAHVLREHLVFKIAPMLYPDGVYLGNYRCSLMGFDLNRHWLDPSPWAHPTLYGVKQLIIQMYNDPKTSLEFYIDIHAHSTMMNGFMYGNVFEDEERFQRQAIFPKLLCQNAEDFSYVSQDSLSPPALSLPQCSLV
ncbi:Cytosolic carboxypeptidase 6 [Myotis brandtii]|uniref:Cytosolic carboxypeptidase 6 n=1 Tax=Myotis brandtii TaxID=109478 RepID=S7MTD6_MYOBR|nr:Cytosolic carboxypeptidase 6 [Myotis brandtii]